MLPSKGAWTTHNRVFNSQGVNIIMIRVLLLEKSQVWRILKIYINLWLSENWMHPWTRVKTWDLEISSTKLYTVEWH